MQDLDGLELSEIERDIMAAIESDIMAQMCIAMSMKRWSREAIEQAVTRLHRDLAIECVLARAELETDAD